MTLLDADDRREMLAAVGGTVAADGEQLTAVITTESVVVDEVAGLWNDIVTMIVVTEDAAAIILNTTTIVDGETSYRAVEKQKAKDGFAVYYLTEDF